MNSLDHLVPTLAPAIPPLLVIAIGLLSAWLCNWFFLQQRSDFGKKHSILRQSLVIGLITTSCILFLLLLPIPESTHAQLLSLLGILVTGVIALSSTTFVSNAMAGLMLRLVRNFRTGDFIRINNQFGRVSERGFLHTEIQTEDRDLTTFPNLYLITNPVTVVRKSGTLINASVSLGYDVPQSKIKSLLLQAGSEAGLEEVFVHVIDLGDFAVSYKVSGFLGDIKTLLTARSHLKSCVLDALHGASIEIVSPNFMNQRVLKNDDSIIPSIDFANSSNNQSVQAEDLMFDKADEAESLERLEQKAEALKQTIKDLKEKDIPSEEEDKQLQHLLIKIAVMLDQPSSKTQQ